MLFECNGVSYQMKSKKNLFKAKSFYSGIDSGGTGGWPSEKVLAVKICLLLGRI